MALLKAPSYKLVEENSKFTSSYSFSLDQPSKKSLFYPMCKLQNLGDFDQPIYDPVGMTNSIQLSLVFTNYSSYFEKNLLFPAGSHADDLMYIFHLNLPIVLCDLQTFLVNLSAAFIKCVADVGLSEAASCVTNPEGEFKTNYGECLFGTLNEEESKTSDAMVKAWTNFAIHG